MLLSGHNRGLQELIFDLVPPEAENALFDAAATKYPTATYAVLELEIEDWGDLGPNCGLAGPPRPPRDLDPELGPEGRFNTGPEQALG